jgi:hypothetical protein
LDDEGNFLENSEKP